MTGSANTATITRRYKAFVSYSHAADAQLAAALQSALQQFGKPWYRLRAMRLFRDVTTMAANPALWSAIERALDASEYFILLASPTAAASPWVQREVEHWLTRRSAHELLIVVTDGEVHWSAEAGDFDWARTNALPRSLEGAFGQEPLYVDLRAIETWGDTPYRSAAFRSAVADLAAALTGRSKDEVIGEDVRQHRRTKQVSWAAGLSLFALAGLAGLAARTAAVERDRAVREQQVAFARRLAARAELVRQRRPDLLPVSVLLALESLRISPSDEAREILRATATLLPTPGRRLRHDGPVTFVASSSDGTRLLTKTSGTARIWAIDSARVIRDVKLDNAAGTVMSPDGRLLATAEFAGLRLLDIGTGDVVARFAIPNPVRALAFSPDGRRLGTTDYTGTVRILDLPSGRELARMKHDIIAMAIAFSGDGRVVVTGSNDNTARIWEVATGREILKLPHRFGAVSVAITHDASRLATGSWDGAVRIWEGTSGLELARLTHLPIPTSLVFSPDGQLLASASDDNTARVWDVSSGQEVFRMTHADDVTSVSFTPDGASLLTASKDSSVRMWGIRSGSEVARYTGDGTPLSTDVSPDGRAVATTMGTSVRVWGALTGRLTSRLPHASRVEAVAYSPDSTHLVTAADDGLHFWELRTARETRHVRVPVPATDVIYSPDGHRVAAALFDRTARVWNVATMEEEVRLQHDESATFINRVVFHPDGRGLATASSDRVRVWDLSTRKVTHALEDSRDVKGLAFSPDGRLLATAGSDGTVRIRDWSRGTERRRIVGSDPMTDVAFSPDGRYLATSSRDRTVRVWDLADGAEVARMRHGGVVNAVAFSRDGAYLVSAGSDLTARMWRWQPEDLTTHACARLLRNLTAEEWREYVGTTTYHRSCETLPAGRAAGR